MIFDFLNNYIININILENQYLHIEIFQSLDIPKFHLPFLNILLSQYSYIFNIPISQYSNISIFLSSIFKYRNVVIRCYLMSYHVISCHLSSSDVIFCHLMSSDVIIGSLNLFGEYIYKYTYISIYDLSELEGSSPLSVWKGTNLG